MRYAYYLGNWLVSSEWCIDQMDMMMSCLPALPRLASPCMALTSRRALKAWHYLVCVANYCCLPAPGVNLYKHTHRQHVWGAQLHGEPFRIAVAASAASASPSAGGSAWQWFSYVGRPVYLSPPAESPFTCSLWTQQVGCCASANAPQFQAPESIARLRE